MADTPLDIWSLTDLETPWSIRVAVTLGIADRIAAGIDDVPTLAREVGADEEALRRVLQHLVGRGVFAEPERDQLALTATSRQLLGHQSGLDLDGIGGRMAGAYGTLLEVVRSGRPAYAERFGHSFWDDLAANPALSASFDDLIGPGGHPTPSPDVLLSGDWEGVGSVVDVGGGTGSLLAEILRTHPSVRGTLIDRPDTLERARALLAEHGMADRVTFVPQSFFDPLPAGADLYVVRHVLNDWPDREKTAIIRRCAEALPPQGRVVVVGGVVPDEEARHRPDLLMLVLLGAGACSLTRFRSLAADAGLRVAAAGAAPGRDFVVECRPA